MRKVSWYLTYVDAVEHLGVAGRQQPAHVLDVVPQRPPLLHGELGQLDEHDHAGDGRLGLRAVGRLGAEGDGEAGDVVVEDHHLARGVVAGGRALGADLVPLVVVLLDHVGVDVGEVEQADGPAGLVAVAGPVGELQKTEVLLSGTRLVSWAGGCVYHASGIFKLVEIHVVVRRVGLEVAADDLGFLELRHGLVDIASVSAEKSSRKS